MEHQTLGRTEITIPRIGLGTWGIGGGMGPDTSADHANMLAIQYGLDLGMNFIDTAEMYGAGHSEEIVGRAIAGKRRSVFLATKVSPQHFSHDDVLGSAKKSLERLKVDSVDLYQLHWPNPRVPIVETMRAMEKLVHEGQVNNIGVSNFSVEQVKEAQSALSREQIVSNQVEYSLLDRTPERNGVLEQCQHEGITLIAYSPLGQGGLFKRKGGPIQTLDKIAARHHKTRSQAALNWLLQKDPVIVIPKSSQTSHITENAGAIGWRLSPAEVTELDQAFK